MEAFQHRVKVEVSRRRLAREVQGVLTEAQRYANKGELVHSLHFCNKALSMEAVDDIACELLALKAEVQLAQGELCKAILDIVRITEKYPEITNKEVLCKMIMVRAAIFVSVGADELFVAELKGNEELLDGVRPLIVPQLKVSASEWHQARRRLILSHHPEVHDLFENKVHHGSHLSVFLLVLSMFHVVMTMVVSGSGFLMVVFVAATVGASCSFGFQALNHDISHKHVTNPLHFVSMVLGSSLCNFPWAMYYHYFHHRHHAFTGMEGDRDGDILFHPWHSPPCIELRFNRINVLHSKLVLRKWSESFKTERANEDMKVFVIDFAAQSWLRFLWTVIASLMLFPIFLVRKAWLDVPHTPFVEYEGMMLAAHILVYRLSGWTGVFYLILSSMFSVGGFCHPYFGFWLIQHQAIERFPNVSPTLKSMHPKTVLQPTKSYSGPFLWNALNYGELWHVEHHDFPMIPASLYPKLKSIAGEFYRDLVSEPAVTDSIKDWLCAKSDDMWMMKNGDFANRHSFLSVQYRRFLKFPSDTSEQSEIDLDRWYEKDFAL